MKEEPSNELIGFESHGLLFISISIIPPPEGYIAVPNFEDTVIADSDSVGISAKVLKDALGTIERRLAVDNPFFMVELSSEHIKGFGILEMTNTSGEDKLTRLKAAFEIIQELAPEQCGHDPHRDEKSLSA
jgi:hypothetical protein